MTEKIADSNRITYVSGYKPLNGGKYMRTASEIDKQLQAEYYHVAQLYVQVKEHEHNIESLKKELKETEQNELEKFIDEWLMETFGIRSQKEARKGIFIVFDENANFVKTVRCGYGAEFQYVSPPEKNDTLEHWLKENKMYAHAASSFCGRNHNWYQMSFKEQLKKLCWEFDKNGKLTKTQW